LHLRCFYRRGPAAGVIPIKGTEVMADDVLPTIAGLRTLRHKANLLSGLEHLLGSQVEFPLDLI